MRSRSLARGRSLNIASRIRGHVECGWSDKDSKAASVPKTETGSAA